MIIKNAPSLIVAILLFFGIQLFAQNDSIKGKTKNGTEMVKTATNLLMHKNYGIFNY